MFVHQYNINLLFVFGFQSRKDKVTSKNSRDVNDINNDITLTTMYVSETPLLSDPPNKLVIDQFSFSIQIGSLLNDLYIGD